MKYTKPCEDGPCPYDRLCADGQGCPDKYEDHVKDDEE